MKISGSAPGKVILFGEWAVLEGGPGVAMACPPRLRVDWKVPDERIDEATLLLRGDGHMALWDPNVPLDKQFQIPKFLIKTLKLIESMMLLDPQSEAAFRRGGELRIDRSWPLDAGLGSSSAIVAVLLELVAPERQRVEKWHLGRECIRRAQGGAASGLDLAAQLRGGSVSLSGDRPRPLSLEIPSQLLFLRGAGEKADTSAFVKENRVPQDARRKLGKSCENFLETRDWVRAINEHSEILADCDLWPQPLRQAREEWLAQGLVKGMKSCGAGGGDTWLLWSEADKRQALEAEVTAQNWILEAVKVSEEGCRREKI
jgi:phosphomevalonate kinase